MRKIALVLCCLTLFVACSPRNYTPTMFNAPLFEKKNQFHGAFSYMPGLSGFHGQLSYSVSNHIALMVNANNRSKTTNSINLQHLSGELGVGFFAKGSSNWISEGYLGYGRATGNFEGPEAFGGFVKEGDVADYKINSSFGKFFAQYNGGMRLKEGKIETGFVLRASILHYSDFTIKKENYRTQLFTSASYPGHSAVFFEPGGFFRVGGELKFQAQVGASYPIGKSYTLSSPVILNCGIVYSIR